MSIVRPGLERFLNEPPAEARDARIGLLTNPSGIDRELRSAVDMLSDHPHLTLAALFGPEHGVRGETQAGEHVTGGVDAKTGLPVHSLYGSTHTPTREMLADIDTMVVDIQDIGVRYATYLSTVAHVIDACAEYGKTVIILDRPNPLGGARVNGNMLDPAFASFVGIHRMPIVHGLTIGEFGRLWARDHDLPEPVVVPMAGWTRDMWYDDTGLPWVLPSPNLPTVDSVTIYPATCLIEGTELSEGRGTTRPFEIVGAPWIDPESLVEALSASHVDGVRFRPLYFTPTFSKHHGTRCGGVQIYVRDRHALDAVMLGPVLLATIKRLYPNEFTWLAPRGTEYFIDKLAGGSELRECIDSGSSIKSLLSRWSNDADDFMRDRSDILLY